MTPVKSTSNTLTNSMPSDQKLSPTDGLKQNSKKSPLWSPSKEIMENCSMKAFLNHINHKYSQSFNDYWQLYRWSIDNIEDFWSECWNFARIKGSLKGPEHAVLEPHKRMDDFPRWFPQRQLNFAKNLLWPCREVDPESVAVHFRAEIGDLSKSLTWNQLRRQVVAMRGVLKDRFGIGKGDRIAAYAHNSPEVLVYMLAGASLGAIFTAGSPDFGPTAIVDRFSQTKPKVLLSCNAVYYNGKIHDHYGKLEEVVQQCRDSLEQVILIDYIKSHGKKVEGCRNLKYHNWDALLLEGSIDKDSSLAVDSGNCGFEEFDFDIPLYIVYSSGTTGKPKCIVHGAGGSLIQHLKEHLLHGNVKAGDVMMQYTTIGWMMWQWLVSGLAAGATVVLYDGSPFRPDPSRLWDLVGELGVTHFGTSAKYLQSLQDTAHRLPSELPSLRVIFSTGSPLPADTFRYVYERLLPSTTSKSVQLASITGGTDILSLFAGGCPLLPVYAGEIQAPCLGMALACFEGEEGKIYAPNFNDNSDLCGDLVCIRTFPSQPVSFWLDDPVKKDKYRAAYFSAPECPGVWHHGDFIFFSGSTGGLVMLGRSDGTLNPAGVRFGSADLYAICGNEKNSKWIADSLAVGVKLSNWKDEQVFLFLLLKPEAGTDLIPEEHLNDLKAQIRTQLSPRHVPAHIHPVPAIPQTLNGKKVEVSVKRILNGNFDLEVLNLSNPESVDFYRKFAKELHEGNHLILHHNNNNKL